MAGKIVNGIVFNNPNAAAESSLTEKVYEKKLNKYKGRQPEFNVVIQSEVKSK